MSDNIFQIEQVLSFFKMRETIGKKINPEFSGFYFLY